MICTFFGHRTVPCGVKEALHNAVMQAIEEKGVREFYVGNDGGFDRMVQEVLEAVVRRRCDIVYFIVLSRVDESALNGQQERTLFPEGFESFLPRFAIFKRNEWLIRRADIAIVYLTCRTTNCYQWAMKAERKGIQVLYL